MDATTIVLYLATLPQRVRAMAHDERGDLSAYLAQGILALATLSLAGVMFVAFGAVGDKLKSIVDTWVNTPISQP